MRSRPRFIGFPAAHPPVDFSSRRLLATASPSLRCAFTPRIQLSSQPLLFRVPSPPCSTRRLPKEIGELNLPRFLALFATSRALVHFSARLPISSRTFRPQAFTTSRRFSPRTRLRAYFIPLPRPVLSCSGSSPLTQPPFLIGKSLPPCRCSRRAHRRSDVHAPLSRLRGLYPRESALRPNHGYSPPPGLAPLVRFFSSRSSSSRVADVLLACSAHDVA